MKTLTRKEAEALFFASRTGDPVSIVYMHYSARTRRSDGPVRVARAHCRPMGPSARGLYLSYRDADTGRIRNFYEACWLMINDYRIDFKNLSIL